MMLMARNRLGRNLAKFTRTFTRQCGGSKVSDVPLLLSVATQFSGLSKVRRSRSLKSHIWYFVGTAVGAI